MGWFDEQIRQRKENDTDIFSESVYDIVGSVSGEKTFFGRGNAKNEIDRILEYYGVKSRDLPGSVKELDAQLEYLIRPHGIMKRAVTLKNGWHKDGVYPMLTTMKDGTVTALIPKKHGGYMFTDKKSGRLTKVSTKNEALFNYEAICFYKPFPLRKLSEKELVNNICRTVSSADIVIFALASLIAVLISMAVPAVYRILFTYVAPQKAVQPLIAAMILLVCTAFCTAMLDSVKKLIGGRLKNSMKISSESAVMMRILSLPASFFKTHSAGELSEKMKSVATLSRAVSEAVVMSGMTALFSLFYFVWIAVYVPSLLLPAVGGTVVTALFLAVSVTLRIKSKRRQTRLAAEEQEISYSLISAISKIKLVGAEKRAFAKWGKRYAAHADKMYNLPSAVKYEKAVTTLITVLTALVIYCAAANNGVSAADFYAFSAAYGVITAALASFADSTDKFADIKPSVENIKTFFDEAPEISGDKQPVTHLSGGIELNNVSFKYDENKRILDNISLKIRPGEYVAVVGKTGCGKSTFIRLLLGFEKPQKGAVYYDGKDMSTLDLKTLRQKIGIVLQNGKLFSGDIFSNIAISAGNITVEQAWDAAEKAGVAEDIRNMPMGMYTVISEGGGDLSGGQRQRILIARAFAANPRIIVFDEATSALDNITQKIVSDTLESVRCTRIIVAHRLSTIEKCGRIIVLDNGKIVEDGSYEELMKKDGLFAQLANGQKIK